MIKKILKKTKLVAFSVAVLIAVSFGFKISQEYNLDQNQNDSSSRIFSKITKAETNRVPDVERIIKEKPALPLYGNWKKYSSKNGLPADKAYCVRIVGDKVLVGTHEGLAVLTDGKWKTYTTEDGLAHNGVLAIDYSELTGDIWLGTMGGLSRWSAGRFENFTQLNSGMPNDLIYSVACDGKDVWVATGGGAGKYDTYTKKWEIFTEQNAPMHEPWTYGVCEGDGKIFIAAWGGGIVEYNKKTGKFRDYVDPDGNMEIDLFPDDGVVHDITTATSWANGYLWVATYFGLSRYDGVHWKGYFDHDSGLASNFINFIRANGPVAYICTDKGLSCTDGKNWITYSRNENNENGQALITEGKNKKVIKMSPSIAHNFVLGVDVKDDVIWVATEKGVSRGKLIKK